VDTDNTRLSPIAGWKVDTICVAGTGGTTVAAGVSKIEKSAVARGSGAAEADSGVGGLCPCFGAAVDEARKAVGGAGDSKMEKSADAKGSDCTMGEIGVDAMRTWFLVEAEEGDSAVRGTDDWKIEKSLFPRSD